ncbi:uncharacterized protein TNIN_247981 [Trichonephila inaurata madagascariensis]|uniref:Uncharacterized protein n=1 Tax=Trichonephila inaurata madagascariensis TaxID=2747483 RepID=A0A8X6MK45_9ARAC|nr:uncharacterized protein TNIN_247981 [Trichonephila inaurata madagascariensis]
MDEIFFESHTPVISTLLTLRKISNSEQEMKYITVMRNRIMFQISSAKDSRYLSQRFLHKIIMERRNLALFQKCLSHALSEIMKSSVLDFNSGPIRHWTTVIADDVDNPSGQLRAEIGGRSIGITAMDQVLVPSFRDLMTNDWFLFLNRRLNMNIPCNRIEHTPCTRYLNPMHETTWRRLYDDNITFFFYEYDDFILYVKEQTLESKPVNMFKEIMERQIGKTFNTTAVLGRIASPYYYVLPHQDEQEYATLKAYRRTRHYRIEQNSPYHMAYRFYCDLNIGWGIRFI